MKSVTKFLAVCMVVVTIGLPATAHATTPASLCTFKMARQLAVLQTLYTVLYIQVYFERMTLAAFDAAVTKKEGKTADKLDAASDKTQAKGGNCATDSTGDELAGYALARLNQILVKYWATP